ncbi:MAG: PRC-barrel domain-containing protein [Hyphomicrobium sp.]
MIRTLSLAAIMAVAVTFHAPAEEAKTKIEPGTGPTSTMTGQVPQMKSDAEAAKQDGASATPLPAAKAMGDAVPPMRPGDATTGQTGSKSTPSPIVAETQPQSPTMALTELEGKNWIDKPVYSIDGKNIGEVVSFQRNAANQVIGMHADIGGFFGIGETRINLTPEHFKLNGDRVELDLTADQANKLPAVEI